MQENLLDHSLITQRYFFPRPDPIASPFWVECGDARLACYWHKVDEKAGTVVHFHGNGEVVGDYIELFAKKIGAMGFNCFLAEYRGYGLSTGIPGLGRILADVPAIINSLQIPPQNLVLFGRSLGSIPAIHAVSLFPEIAGIVLESSIASPLERLLLRLDPEELGVSLEELTQSVEQQLNHRAKLAEYNGPALIMHTQYDGLIDPSHALHLKDWLKGPRTLRIFPHGNHNDIMFVNVREYFSLLAEFLGNVFQQANK